MRTTMRRLVILAAVILAALAAAFFAPPTQRFLAQRAAFQAKSELQKTLVNEIQSAGGRVGYAPVLQPGMFQLADIASVTLTGKPIDGDLYGRLTKLSTVRRLSLDGSNLNDTTAMQLVALRKLEGISMANTQVGDQTVSLMAGLPQLKSMSLRGTAITDESTKSLASMVGLVSLDVSNTALTPDGVATLAGTPALRSLTLDEKCITPSSVAALASMKELSILEVRIPSGLGKAARDMLSTKLAVQVDGISASGFRLWNANTPWEGRVAGVVDIVANEVQLTIEERDRLLEIMRDENLEITRERSGEPVNTPGEPINTVDELISFLKTRNGSFAEFKSYVQSKFQQEDIPVLLQAVEQSLDDANQEFVHVGLFLLAHYGIHDPNVRALLERLFRDPSRRENALYAFDFGWNIIRTRWPARKEVAEFAMPLLLDYAKDYSGPNTGQLWGTLAGLAIEHPQYVPDVIPFYPRWLREGKNSSGSYYLKTLVEKNHEAGLAILPELRKMLASPEVPTFSGFVQEVPRSTHELMYRRDLNQAISFMERYSPESKQIAIDDLERLRRGDGPVGEMYRFSLLATSNNPDTVATVVRGLIDLGSDENSDSQIQVAPMLAEVARAIRDRRIGKFDSS